MAERVEGSVSSLGDGLEVLFARSGLAHVMTQRSTAATTLTGQGALRPLRIAFDCKRDKPWCVDCPSTRLVRFCIKNSAGFPWGEFPMFCDTRL